MCESKNCARQVSAKVVGEAVFEEELHVGAVLLIREGVQLPRRHRQDLGRHRTT